MQSRQPTRQPDSTRVLVVEDEPVTRKRVTTFLKRNGYQVHTADKAATVPEELERFRPHVVLLDILLPDSSDFSLAARITQSADCGLIITSGFDTREDRLKGLRAGADDYLTKPCDMDELLLKVQRLAARVRQNEEIESSPRQCFRFADWLYNPDIALLKREDGTKTTLTHKEKLLLGLFLQHPRRLFSRSQLIAQLQPDDSDVYDRAIDTRISRLRKKIEVDAKYPIILKSIYGEGYVLDVDVHRVLSTSR
jgi:two-component system OmpR family response regulator